MSIQRRLILGLCLALPCVAQAQTGPITVQEAWTRAAIKGGVGGGFMTLRNTGTTPDRLVSGTTAAARVVELHTTVREGDVMRMQPVQGIEVPPGGSVTLRPGGLHIMLIDLAEALRPGGKVPLTLTFERAGAISVELEVRAAGAGGGHSRH